VSIAEDLGVPADLVVYQKSPPDRATLEFIVAHLEDPVADLVRKDSQFKKLGLDEADYTTPEAVVELLLKHKMLMQRPVVVKGNTAIIGRPKDRVSALLGGA
jgi:arsenate reductase (glutaredoxin)